MIYNICVYIDPVDGSDANDGRTELTARKTWAGGVRCIAEQDVANGGTAVFSEQDYSYRVATLLNGTNIDVRVVKGVLRIPKHAELRSNEQHPDQIYRLQTKGCAYILYTPQTPQTPPATPTEISDANPNLLRPYQAYGNVYSVRVEFHNVCLEFVAPYPKLYCVIRDAWTYNCVLKNLQPVNGDMNGDPSVHRYFNTTIYTTSRADGYKDLTKRSVWGNETNLMVRLVDGFPVAYDAYRGYGAKAIPEHMASYNAPDVFPTSDTFGVDYWVDDPTYSGGRVAIDIPQSMITLAPGSESGRALSPVYHYPTTMELQSVYLRALEVDNYGEIACLDSTGPGKPRTMEVRVSDTPFTQEQIVGAPEWVTFERPLNPGPFLPLLRGHYFQFRVTLIMRGTGGL